MRKKNFLTCLYGNFVALKILFELRETMTCESPVKLRFVDINAPYEIWLNANIIIVHKLR